MTAEEAIKILRSIAGYEGMPKRPIEAFETAIEALEEVEQYRALGTVEELKEAREKQIPKKPKNISDYYIGEDYDYSTANCSNCGDNISFDEYRQPVYCEACGQKLDWSEEE